MCVWVNGRLVGEGDPAIRPDDHGLVVGDGVFETVKVLDGQPFALNRHLSRLQRSAAGLGLGLDVELVRTAVKAVLAADEQSGEDTSRQRLRITVTGGPSPYGSDRGNGPATLAVASAPLTTWPATAAVAIVPWARNEWSAVAGLKTISYAENVVALARAHSVGAAEAIFANTRGELCEGTGSNVFLGVDGRLVTPPLTSGCLAGITRELLLEWLGDVEERPLPIRDLAEADEAFLASSTRDVQAIATVDGSELAAAPGPLTQRALAVWAERAAESMEP
jgi:branched-chain amino acid aminotransferase